MKIVPSEGMKIAKRNREKWEQGEGWNISDEKE